MQFVGKHKKLLIFALLLLAAGGYYQYQAAQKANVPPRYVLGAAQKGDIIVSVSGTGQVSASSQIDIKPKVSAQVLSIKAKEKQLVKAGDVIMQLDNYDLSVQAEQAKNSLQSAQAALNLKLIGPTAEDIAVSQNSINSAKLSYQASLSALDEAKRTADQNLQKAKLQVDNAQLSLSNAQTSYDNAVSSGALDTNNSTQSLTNAYDNAKTTITASLLTMRSAVLATDNILGIDHTATFPNRNVLSAMNSQVLNDARTHYYAAKASLDGLETEYNNSSGNWTTANEDALLIHAATALSNAKDMLHDIYGALTNTITASDLSQATLDSYRSGISSQENSAVSAISSLQGAAQSIISAKSSGSSTDLNSSSSLAGAKNSLATAKNNFTSAQSALAQTILDNKTLIENATNDVAQKKISFDNAQFQYNLKVAKPRPEDLASSYLQISQAQNSYAVALKNLQEARVVSPIDGEVAKIVPKKGDDVSSGTAVATVITTDKIAEITLNEVDAAKVSVGQKASLTFSAIDGLTISGVVASVDTLGVVSSGVVNYTVKIAFDTQDDRIKPGMSVSASIITDSKLGVLILSNSAIKTDNNGNYVEVLTGAAAANIAGSSAGITWPSVPTNKYIQTGLANDTNTEIIQGITEADPVVTQTITKTSTVAAPSGTNAMRMLGGGGGR